MQMRKKIVNGMEVLVGTDNVYADLGFPNAEEMQVKARLAYKITESIKAKGWTQQQAAEATGMPQPKLSQMLRGQFHGISEAKLMECLTRLGYSVQIVVGKPSSKKSVKPVEVLFA